MKITSHRLNKQLIASLISFLFTATSQASITETKQTPIKENNEKATTSSIALPSKTKNAWKVPAFKLKGLDNEMHSLDEWKGKVILLNFWASWCAPCQHEIKEFVKYQKHFEKNNFQIISIGVDSERKLRNVSRTLRINYPVLFADIEQPSGKEILAQWGNTNGYIPYSVIINAEGNIHYIHRGQLDEGSFNFYVVPLLKN